MASAVSVKDVARHARVSLGTVSNVLNRPHTVSPQTRDRVLASIDALGYVRNEAARHLRAGSSRTIGFIVMDVSNPFFTDVARAAEATARAAGSALLIADSGDDPEREQAYLDLFEEQRAQGVLISPSGDVTGKLERLRARGIPTVLVDSPAPAASYSSVQTDDVAGGTMAAQHLIEMGRRSIAFVGGPLGLHQLRDREEGARRAASNAGVAFRVWPTVAPTVMAGRDAGHAISALPPHDRPDAIFAGNDLLAIGIMQSLVLEHGVRIPEDVALIGYDDIGWAESSFVPLSSVRQPSGLIGERGAALLLAEARAKSGAQRESDAEHPDLHQHLLFTPELVARDSTVGAAARTAR